MARNSKKRVNEPIDNKRQEKPGRTSNMGRKLASGGSTETDNQGRPNADNPQGPRKKNTGIGGRRV